MDETKVGTIGEREGLVSRDKTALAMGSGSLEVFATPAMIALMEAAACAALGLPESETSVGTAISVSHVSATPVGAQVRARAQITAVDGRSVEFAVKAYDEAGLIGEGTHTRFIVDAERFMQKARNKLV